MNCLGPFLVFLAFIFGALPLTDGWFLRAELGGSGGFRALRSVLPESAPNVCALNSLPIGDFAAYK